MSRDFLLFSWIIFPPAPEYSSRTVSNFSKIRRDIRKSRNGPNVVWGKLIHVEKVKSKISWHCHFKQKLREVAWRKWTGINNSIKNTTQSVLWAVSDIENWVHMLFRSEGPATFLLAQRDVSEVLYLWTIQFCIPGVVTQPFFLQTLNYDHHMSLVFCFR